MRFYYVRLTGSGYRGYENCLGSELGPLPPWGCPRTLELLLELLRKFRGPSRQTFNALCDRGMGGE